MMMPIRVLVVDDAASMRQLLTKVLETDPSIKVVGAVEDAYRARDLIKALNPDVLTLDVEMPRMHGLTFLDNLMRLHPMPVVMISSRTSTGADATLRALESGAIDFVLKREMTNPASYQRFAREVTRKVRVAATAKVGHAAVSIQPNRTATLSRRVVVKARRGGGIRVVAIGSSTGGPEALRHILTKLRCRDVAVLIAQHMPEAFCKSLAERLDSVSTLRVSLATDGQPIESGCGYVAPGNRHLRVGKAGPRYVCRLDRNDPINGHRPSVAALFDSVADVVGAAAVGVLLTGMGKDGAESLRRLQKAGGVTVAQDERTSIVWGMPGSAVKIGAVDEVLPVHQIADALNQLTSHASTTTPAPSVVTSRSR